MVQIPDIYVDPRVPHDAHRPTFVKSPAMAPIRSAAPTGPLGAYWSVEHTPTQVRLLEVLASSASVALENLELRGAVVRRSSERDSADLTAVGHEVARGLEAQVGVREVETAIEDGLRAAADPVLTHLLLENLLGNAVKHTAGRRPPGSGSAGPPRTRARRWRPSSSATTATASPRGRRTCCSGAMTRLHTDAEFAGTGLGLASAARIVELHGGRIRAEGERSVGAAFHFSLPATG